MKKTTSYLVLLAVVGLFAAPAFAGLLDSGGIYDGWQGRSYFTSENPNLHGYVDWGVFDANSFPFTDSSLGPAPSTYFTSTPNELTYAYQVVNEGSDSLSMQIVFIDSYADNIGGITDLTKGLSGDVPNLMQLDTPGGSAVWGFDGIAQNSKSEGLAYCSSYTPMMAEAAITLDGGTYGISTVQVPSAVPIPEPATLWLIAAACVFVARYIRRR